MWNCFLQAKHIWPLQRVSVKQTTCCKIIQEKIDRLCLYLLLVAPLFFLTTSVSLSPSVDTCNTSSLESQFDTVRQMAQSVSMDRFHGPFLLGHRSICSFTMGVSRCPGHSTHKRQKRNTRRLPPSRFAVSLKASR